MPGEVEAFTCYLITNEVSGRQYVGITHSVAKRWRQHVATARAGGGGALHQAIRKHGAEAFTVRVLSTHATWAEAQAAERAAILTLRTKGPHGYNMTDGGDGVIGLSPESARRRRANFIQTMETPAVREKLRKAWAEAKAERVEKLREVKARPEVREKHREAMARPELREKLRKAKASPEAREICRTAGRRGSQSTMANEEARERRRESCRRAALARWARPEEREKFLNAMARPEGRERQREAARQATQKQWACPETRERRLAAMRAAAEARKAKAHPSGRPE